MSIEFEFVPYKTVGKCNFGMTHDKVVDVYGNPITMEKYGYPVEDGYVADYGIFRVNYDKDLKVEAIEIFPNSTKEEILLIYMCKKIRLSTDISELQNELSKITDDCKWNHEDEGYSSDKLGIKTYCPDDCVEQVFMYHQHYYD